MKYRTLEKILDRVGKVEDLRKAFYESHWIPWFKKIEDSNNNLKYHLKHGNKCHCFWGILEENKVIFCIWNASYSINAITTPAELTLTADYKDLPLLIGNPAYDANIIEERLKGNRKSIPLRQDFVDEYKNIEKRSHHQNTVFSLYEKELLNRYICQRERLKLVILKRKDKTFYLDLKNQCLLRQSELESISIKAHS